MDSAKEKLEIVSGGARRRPPPAAKRVRAISSVARRERKKAGQTVRPKAFVHDCLGL